MKFRQLFSLAIICLIGTASGTTFAQLTWDPDGNQTSDGGDGNWNNSALNWDDNGAPPNVAWSAGSSAIFGKKSDNSTSLITVDGFNGVTVGNITLEAPNGSGAVNFNTNFDGTGLTVAAGGATWELGGRTLAFINDQTGTDTTLSMTSGDTLTITDASGGGVFNTGEKPASATWSVGGATLDIQDGVTVRGNTASVGQFANIKLSDGSTYIHERNTPEAYAASASWELTGNVFFDNNFNNRQFNLDGVVSGSGTLNVKDLGIPETNNNGFVGLRNSANTFTGGVIVDSTNSRAELNVAAAGDGAFGAVPGTFDADNIKLVNGGELKINGATINSNRGIFLDGGGTLVLTGNPSSYGGTISGTGGLQIGRQAGSDGNRIILTSNTPHLHRRHANLSRSDRVRNRQRDSDGSSAHHRRQGRIAAARRRIRSGAGRTTLGCQQYATNCQ